MASSSMTSSSSSAAGRAGGVASAGCRRASTAVEFQAPLEVGTARTSARLFACNRIECPGRSKPAALKIGLQLDAEAGMRIVDGGMMERPGLGESPALIS